MPTRKDWSRASRWRTRRRGAKEILLRIAQVFAALGLAPVTAMVVIPFERRMLCVLDARVEQAAVFP
jgi:hypothetical protein